MAEFQPIDEATFQKMAKPAKARTVPKALSARYDARSRRIVMRLDNGVDVAFEPRLAHGLEHAAVDDLKVVQVTGYGSALHFARLDADFTISRLLEGFFGPLDWAKRQARAEASRRNGQLGGRPRRAAVG